MSLRIESLMKVQVVTTSQDLADLTVGVQQHRDLAIAIVRGDAIAAEQASRLLVLAPYDSLSDTIGMPKDLRLK